MEESTFGGRLIQAMAVAGSSNAALASHMQVHEKTVSKWRRDKQLPDAKDQDRIADFLGCDRLWLRMAIGHAPGTRPIPEFLDDAKRAFSGVGAVAERHSLSRPLEILAAEFELEAMKAKADEEDMRYIRRALRSPEAVELYRGGYTELSADEQRLEMESLIEMLRLWLKERIRRRSAEKRRQ